MEKTLAVWLGSEKERLKISQTYQLNWVNQFELLGIIFHVTQEKMFQLNFDKRISEIERIINMYSKFSLSLIGRVTVIKTLMLPKIVYLLTVLPTPPGNIFEAIEKRLKDFQVLKEDLRVMRETTLRGNMLRAKSQKYIDFEKPTKYFCNLEKQNYTGKVNKIMIKNETITNQQMILKELKIFYKNLLQSKHEDNQNQSKSPFLVKENIKTLSEQEQVKCEGLITEREVIKVLKDMKNGKSPGTDGYTAEFYKFFWKDIGNFVLESLNESFNTGELSITQKQGLITLLPKGNKPRDLIKNWRPITLLNVDYKLLAGALASRMKEVLPSIIQNEQNGFLKNRYIGENIRTIADSLEYIRQKKVTGMTLQIDFEKAFDSLEWDYLDSVLKVYNFGEEFRTWFSILKINMEKTLAVWLGSEKERLKISQTYQLNWVNQFELLGIIFHVTQEKMFQLNFDKRISEIERIINMYSKFSLSLIGRVTVIKTLMLLKIVYLLTVLPTPPSNIFEAIEKRLKDFLWKNGNIKICNKQLEKEIGEGDLKLTNIRDFNKSLKLSWLKRLLTIEGSWQVIFENYCGIPKKMDLELDGKSLMELVEKIPNPFWKDVLQMWNGFKKCFSKTNDFRTYPLWGTFYMTNPNLSNRSTELISKGIAYVNDLLSNSGDRLGYYDFIERYQIKINFVDFYSLTHSLPSHWLKSGKTQQKEGEMKLTFLQSFLQQKQTSKWVYQKLRTLLGVLDIILFFKLLTG